MRGQQIFAVMKAKCCEQQINDRCVPTLFATDDRLRLRQQWDASCGHMDASECSLDSDEYVEMGSRITTSCSYAGVSNAFVRGQTLQVLLQKVHALLRRGTTASRLCTETWIARSANCLPFKVESPA